MQKELLAWRNEAATWQKRLQAAAQQSQAQSVQQEVTMLDEDIAKKQALIKLLKRQVLENEAKLSQLLDVAVGDV